jgi:hypothetical protein
LVESGGASQNVIQGVVLCEKQKKMEEEKKK